MFRLIVGLLIVVVSGCQVAIPLHEWSSDDVPEPKKAKRTVKAEPAPGQDSEPYSAGSVSERDETVKPIDLPPAPPRQNARRWTNGGDREMSPGLARVVTSSVEASAQNVQSAVSGLANITAQQEK